MKRLLTVFLSCALCLSAACFAQAEQPLSGTYVGEA